MTAFVLPDMSPEESDKTVDALISHTLLRGLLLARAALVAHMCTVTRERFVEDAGRAFDQIKREAADMREEMIEALSKADEKPAPSPPSPPEAQR